MKSAMFVFLVSTLIILEVSAQRCGLLNGCADGQCCALTPLLRRECQNLGQTGERCGLGIFSCPCEDGLTCVNLRCEDRRTTTTEGPEATTEGEPETTTDMMETTTDEMMENTTGVETTTA